MPFFCVVDSVANRLSAALQTALAGTLLPALQLLVCAVRGGVQSRSATANVHAIETLRGWLGMVAILVQNNRPAHHNVITKPYSGREAAVTILRA